MIYRDVKANTVQPLFKRLPITLVPRFSSSDKKETNLHNKPDTFESAQGSVDSKANGTIPNVLVWGAGNLGYATFADIQLQNAAMNRKVGSILTIPRETARALEHLKPIRATGFLKVGSYPQGDNVKQLPIAKTQIINAWDTASLGEAIKNSETIFITMPDIPMARRGVLKKLLKADLKGKTIILSPGGEGGVLEAARLLHKRKGKDITVGLVETAPYVARISSDMLKTKSKDIVKIAAFPRQDEQKLLNKLEQLFPIKATQFKPVHPLEIILSGQNYIYHVAVALDAENLKRNGSYNHYLEGVTPRIAKIMEQLDRERIAIGKKFGLNLEPLNEALNNHYGIGLHSSYYDAFQACKNLYKVMMPVPQDLAHHRYVVEDLPGVAVIERLGKIAGVPTPATSNLKRTATKNALSLGTQEHEIRGYHKALAALPDTLKELKRYFEDPANWTEGTSNSASPNTLPARFIRWIKEDILAKTFQWLRRVFNGFGKFFGAKS